MSHEKYWDYLDAIDKGLMERCIPSHVEAWERHWLYFKLTASPYHYWLNNQAALAQSSPKESSARKQIDSSSEKGQKAIGSTVASPSASVPEVSSNLANKAQEIRQKAKTAIIEYVKTNEAQWSSEATRGLWDLASDWGKGLSVSKALDLIPDRELCMWNDKHGVFM